MDLSINNYFDKKKKCFNHPETDAVFEISHDVSKDALKPFCGECCREVLKSATKKTEIRSFENDTHSIDAFKYLVSCFYKANDDKRDIFKGMVEGSDKSVLLDIAELYSIRKWRIGSYKKAIEG